MSGSSSPQPASTPADGRAPGAAWLTPCLIVDEPEESLAFYEEAFGFTPSGAISKDRHGRIIHAAMLHEGVPLLMLAPANRSPYDVAPPRLTNLTCPIVSYVYCRDVDGLTARARAAGAEILAGPEDMAWGDRVARIEDLDGYMWKFATHLGPSAPILAPGLRRI